MIGVIGNVLPHALGVYMKTYRGAEIMDVIDIMDNILFNSSLREAFDNDRHYYRELVERFPELLDDMMCFMDDNETSYMLVDTDDDEFDINITMWVSIDNSVSLKTTMQYFNCVRNIYKGMTDRVTIYASCRSDTSLPIVKRLNGRKGIEVVIAREPVVDSILGYGFADVRMECCINK